MNYKEEEKKEKNELNEPAAIYKTRFKIFTSFEEQNEYELAEMALLSPLQRLQYLRKFINNAYGMHGYNPDNLPLNHSLRIITYSQT